MNTPMWKKSEFKPTPYQNDIKKIIGTVGTDLEDLDPPPSIILPNGTEILNFSSPHPFNFDTGEVLPACSAARSKALSLEAEETEFPAGTHGIDIALRFKMSDAVREELLRLAALVTEAPLVVLVPFPVMQAIKATWDLDVDQVCMTPFRCVRSADRVTKVIYHNRFCV